MTCSCDGRKMDIQSHRPTIEYKLNGKWYCGWCGDELDEWDTKIIKESEKATNDIDKFIDDKYLPDGWK